MRIQFTLPWNLAQRLRKHPDFPGWRGRHKFYVRVFENFINSAEFKLRELEEENRRLRLDRDQKARDVEFWKSRAGGFQSPFGPKPTPAPPANAPEKTNAA
jgi:hypothetical protein